MYRIPEYPTTEGRVYIQSITRLTPPTKQTLTSQFIVDDWITFSHSTVLVCRCLNICHRQKPSSTTVGVGERRPGRLCSCTASFTNGSDQGTGAMGSTTIWTLQRVFYTLSCYLLSTFGVLSLAIPLPEASDKSDNTLSSGSNSNSKQSWMLRAPSSKSLTIHPYVVIICSTTA